MTTIPTMGKKATSPCPINLQEAARLTAAQVKINAKIGINIWPIAIVSIVQWLLLSLSESVELFLFQRKSGKCVNEKKRNLLFGRT